MNKVFLMGRLTRDPEVRYLLVPNKTAIARYTLAVDRKFKDENGSTGADFIGCVAFGKSGEFAEKYFRKGMKVVIEGRLKSGSYTNSKGDKVPTMEVVIENQEFAEKKKSGGSGKEDNQAAGDTYAGGGFANIPEGIEDEMPFS